MLKLSLEDVSNVKANKLKFEIFLHVDSYFLLCAFWKDTLKKIFLYISCIPILSGSLSSVKWLNCLPRNAVI